MVNEYKCLLIPRTRVKLGLPCEVWFLVNRLPEKGFWRQMDGRESTCESPVCECVALCEYVALSVGSGGGYILTHDLLSGQNGLFFSSIFVSSLLPCSIFHTCDHQ